MQNARPTQLPTEIAALTGPRQDNPSRPMEQAHTATIVYQAPVVVHLSDVAGRNQVYMPWPALGMTAEGQSRALYPPTTQAGSRPPQTWELG